MARLNDLENDLLLLLLFFVINDWADVCSCQCAQSVHEGEEESDLPGFINDLSLIVPDEEGFLQITHCDPNHFIDGSLFSGLRIVMDVS